MRSIDWRGGKIVAVDQTRLPGSLVVIEIETVDALVGAIRRLAIRGAPALGAAGALGAALVAHLSPSDHDAVRSAAAAIRQARPTAVNLAWGVDRALAKLSSGPRAVLDEALAVLDEDVRCNRKLSERGAEWLIETLGRPLSVLTHCNTGGLACVEWGTALGVIRALHEREALAHVYATETRPLLQGARLTTWELRQWGIPHTLVVDSAGPSVLADGRAEAVVVGADRITARADVINKVGTYPLALAATHCGAPMVVAAPESTIDLETAAGRDVDIEIRSPEEVTTWHGCSITPRSTSVLNYAFDITPADLVTAIVTERRTVMPSSGDRP